MIVVQNQRNPAPKVTFGKLSDFLRTTAFWTSLSEFGKTRIDWMWPYYVTAFLSEEEIKCIRVPTQWDRSTVHDLDGTLIDSWTRTSSQQSLHDVWLQNLLTERMNEVLGIPLHFEEGSFVKYEATERYRVHGDAAGLLSGREWTLLLGLRCANHGGTTHFPKLARQFTLQRGDALIWPNYKFGRENEDMDHEARVVRSGTKIIVNAWFTP